MRPDLAAETEEYTTRVQSLARRRASMDRDKFDLMHGLREPRNPMERADIEGLAGIITREQRRAVYLANDPDPKMLDKFFDAWEGQLEHFGAMLQAIIRIATDQRRHPLSRRGEEEVDRHVAAMEQKLPLWSEELEQAFRFLTEVRLDLDGKPVTLGKDSAESAHWLAEQVMGRTAAMWRSCKRTAQRSQTQPEYLYAASATALFYQTMLEKGDLPRPNDLAALMRLERVAAERALAARIKACASVPIAAPRQPGNANVNAANEANSGPAIEKGMEFPDMETPLRPKPAVGSLSLGEPVEPTSSKGINVEHLNEDASPRQPVRGQVFISYSHKDDRWLDDLQTHLKPYLTDASITAWSDQQIATGSKWFAEIRAALARTSVAVLLVTPRFLASDFIQEHELTPILKEAERGGVRIVWIPVRACAYKKTPLREYQAVIDPEKPLATMKANRDAAWVTICQEIERAVKRQQSEFKNHQAMGGE